MSKFVWEPNEKLVRADTPNPCHFARAMVKRFFYRRHEPMVRSMLRESLAEIRAAQNTETERSTGTEQK